MSGEELCMYWTFKQQIKHLELNFCYVLNVTFTGEHDASNCLHSARSWLKGVLKLIFSVNIIT